MKKIDHVLKVLAIPGSLRRGSCNRQLLHAAVALSPPTLSIEVHDGLQDIPLFNEDSEMLEPAAVKKLRAKVAAAHGVLIATPEYNQSFPGVLKNAIDWLSRPPSEALANLPVALAGATTGRWGTRLAQSHLRHVLYACEAAVMPQPSLFIAGAQTLFTNDGRVMDGVVERSIRELLVAFEKWIRTVRVSA